MSERINFGKIKEIIAPPNLIELQTQFVQGIPAGGRSPQSKRKNTGPAGRVHRGVSHRELRRQVRARFSHLRNRRAEARLARMPARRPDLRRAALRHLPAEGREGHQGRKSVHGRTAADDPAGHLRHQWRRARHRQPVAPLARHLLRSHAASERQDAATASASSPTAVPGTKRSSTPAICFTFISTARNAAGNSSTTTFFRAPSGYGLGRRDILKLFLRHRRTQASRKLEKREDSPTRF